MLLSKSWTSAGFHQFYQHPHSAPGSTLDYYIVFRIVDFLNSHFTWCHLTFFKRFYLFIRERERERAHRRRGRGRERGRSRPSCWAGSPMWDLIPGPWVMTWAEDRRLTDWATQVPQNTRILNVGTMVCSSLCGPNKMSVAKLGHLISGYVYHLISSSWQPQRMVLFVPFDGYRKHVGVKYRNSSKRQSKLTRWRFKVKSSRPHQVGRAVCLYALTSETQKRGVLGWVGWLSIWLLILTWVMISGLWDWASHSARSLLEILSLPLYLPVSSLFLK